MKTKYERYREWAKRKAMEDFQNYKKALASQDRREKLLAEEQSIKSEALLNAIKLFDRLYEAEQDTHPAATEYNI